MAESQSALWEKEKDEALLGNMIPPTQEPPPPTPQTEPEPVPTEVKKP